MMIFPAPPVCLYSHGQCILHSALDASFQTPDHPGDVSWVPSLSIAVIGRLRWTQYGKLARPVSLSGHIYRLISELEGRRVGSGYSETHQLQLGVKQARRMEQTRIIKKSRPVTRLSFWLALRNTTQHESSLGCLTVMWKLGCFMERRMNS